MKTKQLYNLIKNFNSEWLHISIWKNGDIIISADRSKDIIIGNNPGYYHDKYKDWRRTLRETNLQKVCKRLKLNVTFSYDDEYYMPECWVMCKGILTSKNDDTSISYLCYAADYHNGIGYFWSIYGSKAKDRFSAEPFIKLKEKKIYVPTIEPLNTDLPF